MRVYFGATHSHTGADNNHGQDDSHARDVFEAAKADGFDFLLLTEHSGPSGPTDPVALYDYLVDQSATHRVLAGFNHPGPRGHHASARRYLNPDVRRLVPFTEALNTYLTDERPDTRLYRAYIEHLERGWRVAPTCGLDSHGLMRLTQDESDEERPCRTGLLAPSLTRDAVLRALMARRIYASADQNLRARYTANDRWMGRVLGPRWTRVHFDVKLSDPDTQQPRDRITRVQIIGEGGRVLASRSFGAHRIRWQVTVNRGRNSYLLVRAFTNDPQQLSAILAPVWFRNRTPRA